MEIVKVLQQEWEYQINVVTIDVYTTMLLNGYGKDGWELVAVVPIPEVYDNDASYRLFFKRPK